MCTARDTIQRHVAQVLDGTVISNHWIRKAAERWNRDLERPELWMDWAEVQRMVDFIQGLKLTAAFAGQNWQLMPWQQWVLAAAVGWRWTDGLTRTRMVLLQVARKNGKTTMMAGLALYHLIGQQTKGRVVSVVANKRDQAKLLLDTAREMARPLLPERDSVKQKAVQHNKIVCDYGIMDTQTASEKSLDGLNPSLWIGDEAAEWKGRFITKMETATIGRDDGLGVIITTPGNNSENVYAEMVQKSEKVLDGEIKLDSWQAFIYGVDDEDSVEDRSCWPKANPSLGSALKMRVLESQWEGMQLTPMSRLEFVRFHLARQIDYLGKWLDMTHWDVIAEPAEIPDGSEVWMGVDLSKSFDMSAVILCRPGAGGTVHLMGRYWYPADHAQEREILYQMPFRRWGSEGRLNLTPGREINWADIRAEILQLCTRYQVKRIAVDPWMAAYFNESLRAEGLPVAEHSQSISMMAPASQTWQNLWVGRKIRHSNDPILRSACANAQAKVDDAGNVRPTKAHSRGLIDPLVAAIMAVHAWSLDQGAPPSMYEDGTGVG
jgi:phage terminase large subunit-like protein